MFGLPLILAALLQAAPNADAIRAEGAARYAKQDFAGSLEVWNRIGEPRVHEVRVRRDEQLTNEAVVRYLAGITPGDVLTPTAYNQAVRRLRELPAAGAVLTYTPLSPGFVDIDIDLDENTVWPTGLFGLGEVGGKAIILSDLQVPVSNLWHHGDVLTTAYRWPSDWRRLLVDYSLPSLKPLHGLTDVQGLWERQTYAAASANGSLTTEDHSQANVTVADWVKGAVRWQTGVSFDGWNNRHHIGVTGVVDVRAFADRLSLGTDDGAWASHRSDGGFARADAWVGWRSTADSTQANWTILSEGATTSANAPFDFWSGAGSGLGRPFLLRAHTILDENVIGGDIFGRSVVHATAEYHRPITEIHDTTIGWALFIDTAHASHRMDGTESSWPVDAGAGVRWGVPGLGSAIRLDLAHGLRDGGWAVSVGWQAPWPRQ